MYKKSLLGMMAGSALALIGVASPASATLTVTTANGGGGNNAIDAACPGPTNSPGNTILGCLNSNHNLVVDFITTNGPIAFAAGGQAKIVASGANLPGFDELKIGLQGFTFNKIVFNIEAASDGSVTFHDSFGDTPVTMALNGSGNNFFTITGANFPWIEFSTTDGTFGHGKDTTTDGDIVDVKQVRFFGVCNSDGCSPSNNPPPAVPEPATLSLLAMGLLGLGLRRRRKA